MEQMGLLLERSKDKPQELIHENTNRLQKRSIRWNVLKFG